MFGQELADSGEAGISSAIQFAPVTENNYVRAIRRLFGGSLVHDSLRRKLVVQNIFLKAGHPEVAWGDVHPRDEGGGGLGDNENLDAPLTQLLDGFGHQSGLPGARTAGDNNLDNFAGVYLLIIHDVFSFQTSTKFCKKLRQLLHNQAGPHGPMTHFPELSTAFQLCFGCYCMLKGRKQFCCHCKSRILMIF